MPRKDLDADKLRLHLEFLFEHGVNFRERVILLNEEIDSETFTLIECALSEMESHNKGTITIKINSDGGSVADALAIVGRIQASPAYIVTEGYGNIMSAATLILASGRKRRISRYATFMTHESSYEVEGRHSQLKAEVAQREKEEHLWAGAMASFTKGRSNKDFWIKHGVGTDLYLPPEEILKLGVVDEVF
jgi:ATP-dependent Clp protease, protease subunit